MSLCMLCGAQGTLGPGHEDSAQHLRASVRFWDDFAAGIVAGFVRPPSKGEKREQLPSMTQAEMREAVEAMPLSADEKSALLRKATKGQYRARHVIAARYGCVRRLEALGVSVTELLE